MENELNQLIAFLKENSREQKSGIFKTSGTQKSVKKADVDVKALVQDLQTNIHSDVPSKSKSSKGFNIQKFEFLMRSKLIDEYKRIQSFDRPYISVTELCSCLRKCYYERKRYDVDINELFRFSYLALLKEVGVFVHKFIQSIYGFTESEKTIISEKFKVKGRVDSIEENILLEFKTVDAIDFKDTYAIEDYHQSLIYSYILNTEYNYKIEGITLVYVLRNFKKVVPFDLEIDSKLAKSFLERAPLLISCIEKNEVVDTIGATIEQCKYCLFKKYCEKDKKSFISRPQPKKEVTSETIVLL